jgi:hypothetical protein
VIQPHHFVPPQGADAAGWLQELGRQLSNQIESARSRRTILARQYEAATGANRAGLEQQLRILDQRIAQLEVDIAQVGVDKAQTVASTAPPGFNPGPLVGGAPTGLFIILAFVLLLPVSIGVAKRIWRRPVAPTSPPGFDEAAGRLERLEQAVETIAIEIERVSEGQRYISKMLTLQDKQNAPDNAASGAALNGGQALPALGSGSPPEAVMPHQEEVRIRRG